MAPFSRSAKTENTPLLQHDPDEDDYPEENNSFLQPSTDYSASILSDDSGNHGLSKAALAKRKTRLGVSFVLAIISCLCAGSITIYSLYAPLFMSRLGYTQLQVNAISIAAELGLYLPVPLFGILCDRTSPAVLSACAVLLFVPGYTIAALTYAHKWRFGWMIFAFAIIGSGTASMYLSAVTTSAKNFGRGRLRGIAIALPIAAFGLSGMWESQVGSRLLYETNPDGSKGEVDVVKFFTFLAILLGVVGLLGIAGLQIVDEEELILHGVEELERSGFLAPQSIPVDSEQALLGDHGDRRQYLSRSNSYQAPKDQKRILLNAETHRFLTDPTMWWLAGGFFLISGPGEGFVNNMGTILISLSPPTDPPHLNYPSAAATQLSIIAVASTVFRLITGSVTDLLAPSATSARSKRFTLSRVPVLLFSAGCLMLGFILLGAGAVQEHPNPTSSPTNSSAKLPFGIVTALVGAGYGGTFSLVPIIISVVWGVENFATNWGIVATVPAVGATVWGVVYANVYDRAIAQGQTRGTEKMCYGTDCYATTAWAMVGSVALACVMWTFAWLKWRRQEVIV